jgi:hypothetical protein
MLQNMQVWSQTHPQNGLTILNMSADFNGQRYGVASSVPSERASEMDAMISAIDSMKRELLENLTPRILRSTWSLEAEQDLRVWHNNAAEQILTEIFARQLINEIYKEIEKSNWKEEGF